jgi:hypothetical protein
MKNKIETLETIHDQLLEEITRLEIAIRNLADRDDDEIIIPRIAPFCKEGQKTKKELVSEYSERAQKVGHAIKTAEAMIEEIHSTNKQSQT